MHKRVNEKEGEAEWAGAGAGVGSAWAAWERCAEAGFPLSPQPCPPLKEHWGQAARAAEYLFGPEGEQCRSRAARTAGAGRRGDHRRRPIVKAEVGAGAGRPAALPPGPGLLGLLLGSEMSWCRGARWAGGRRDPMAAAGGARGRGLKAGLGWALARLRGLGSVSGAGFGGDLKVGIRALAATSLGQGAAASATARWASGDWPACPPSAAGLPRPLPHPRPPSRWPRSCPACRSPARSAPPGPSAVGGVEEKTEGEGRRHQEALRCHC